MEKKNRVMKAEVLAGWMDEGILRSEMDRAAAGLTAAGMLR